jgi:hypothetical protein
MISFRVSVIAAWYKTSQGSFPCYWYFGLKDQGTAFILTVFNVDYGTKTCSLDMQTIRDIDMSLREIEHRLSSLYDTV